MEIILTIAYAAFFIFLIGKLKFFEVAEIPNYIIKLGFILKLLAGISLGLIYTYYYTDRATADTFKFFDDSQVLYDSFFSQPNDFIRMLTGIGAGSEDLKHYYNSMKNWYDVYSPFNDNRTIIRFNVLIRFVSFGYYYVHVAFICFLSLIGIVAIVKVLKSEYPFLAMEFFLILILTPSVLFWGSGLLKDSLVFFSFGMSLFLFHKIIHSRTVHIKRFIVFLCVMFLLMISKFQVFLITIPLFLAWAISNRFKAKPVLSFSVIPVVFVLFLFLLGELIPKLNLLELLAAKQEAFIQLAANSNAGSFIKIPVLEPSVLSFIFRAPYGFATSLFRPYLLDSGALLTTIAGIENTLILLFGIWCIFNIRLQNLSGKILPWFFISYVIFSFTLIGIITPVLGALVRYKAQALPFLIIIFIIISYKNQTSLLKMIYNKIVSAVWK